MSGAMLCRYSRRKGDLLALSCASVLRVECESSCSVLLMFGGVQLSILLCVVDL